MEDNWKHRSKGMTCSTCMWFVPKESSIPQPVLIKAKEENRIGKPDLGPYSGMIMQEQDVEIEIKRIGRCRRHAPTMNGWPVMFSTDWCGDHKLDENKI